MDDRLESRPNLSLLALVSFIASFAVARTFTSLFPSVALFTGDIHIHHFWYGLIMLAIGGWLGISYADERVDRVAAILFGAGGGLIGDEIGLLLTFGEYWSEITYTFMIVLAAFLSVSYLLYKYWRIIAVDFGRFSKSHAGLFFGVFLVAVSIAFITETDNTTVIAISSVSTVLACIIISLYFAQRIRIRS